MKILVPLKQVADPDNANRVRVSADGTTLESGELERKVNPFDEYALETALRLTEDGRAPRQRVGEVVVVTLGPDPTTTMLRSALATGADRAYRVDATDEHLDGRLVANALSALVQREQPDLVLLGKQTVDGDAGEVGPRLAAKLGWPQATFAAMVHQTSANELRVTREVDGGIQTLALSLPAVITVDLRIVSPNSVRSQLTPNDFHYSGGVRFASLPSIMQSKRKPLTVLSLAELCPGGDLALTHDSYFVRNARAAGRRVSSPAELVHLLATEAKVL